MESDDDTYISKKIRKIGVVNKSTYKSEIIKKAGVAGSPYTKYAGKDMPERKPGEDGKLKYYFFWMYLYYLVCVNIICI